jgi:hypothetical protein
MQRTCDCDFFAWANNEMTTYETKIMERLKVLDDRRKADSDRLEKLIEKKYNDQYVKLEKLIEKKNIMINMLNFDGSWSCVKLMGRFFECFGLS